MIENSNTLLYLKEHFFRLAFLAPFFMCEKTDFSTIEKETI